MRKMNIDFKGMEIKQVFDAPKKYSSLSSLFNTRGIKKLAKPLTPENFKNKDFLEIQTPIKVKNKKSAPRISVISSDKYTAIPMYNNP